MLLTIDIGNTSILAGLFKGEKLKKTWRFLTKNVKGLGARVQASGITGIVISSVVPQLDKQISRELQKKFSIKPVFVTPKIIHGINIKLKNPKQVGADRLVNAQAAFRKYGGPIVIIDFGTATTFCGVTEKGEYLGGAIAPGISLAIKSLHENTAKLPLIKFKAPKRVIGPETFAAMQSGIYFGYVSLVEGMIKFFKNELPGKVKVVATGGYAKEICGHAQSVDIINPNLTLEGLQMIWEDICV